MRGRNWRAQLLTSLLCVAVVVLSACTTAPYSEARAGTPERAKAREHPHTEPARPAPSLRVANPRQSRGVVAAGGRGVPYNYGPTVMQDSGRYRMWWCSQYPNVRPPGDDILHAETERLTQRFSGRSGDADVVFSGRPGGFDGMHTCDPSVIKVDGVYYLYYTGAEGDHEFGNSIGVATSDDGMRWTRANAGEPIVVPSGDTTRENTYGAGQPAAVYLDGWFYLMFTDTTASAAGWNGAGQFLLRSPDPTFSEHVESLGRSGFVRVNDTAGSRTSSLVDAFSADLMWSDVLDAFVIAHQTSKGTSLTFWNRDFTEHPYPQESVPGQWREGPGLVRTPEGHAPIAPNQPCATVPIDVIRATQNLSAPTDLRWFGLDLHGARGCDDAERAVRVLDGYALPSPDRTMDLVTGGNVVRVDRRTVAVALAGAVLEHRPEHVAELPVTARLGPGTPVLHSPSAGSGVVLDDGRLWPLRSAEAVALLSEYNGSPQRTVSDRALLAYPRGPALG